MDHVFVVNGDEVRKFRNVKVAETYHRLKGGEFIRTPEDMEKLSGSQLAAIYNQSQGESSKVKKFSDKKTAVKRTMDVIQDVAIPSDKIKTGGKRGRPGKYNKYKIYRNVAENPRRVNTHGHLAWERIVDGMTYDEYMAATEDVPGRGLKHLIWCIERQKVSLKPIEE